VRVCVLGSGSRGNATLVEVGDTRVLVDAGFSGVDLARRLEAVEVDPDSISAILVTHDHRDHTRGAGIYARRHGTPIVMTERTRAACDDLLGGDEEIVPYRAGYDFSIGPIRVQPFLTVHDAADPVGVALVDEETGSRLGVATDLGRPTAQVRHALSACHLLVLEANHDEVLLAGAPYPWSVKARITSSHGHLSNEEAARFATELLHPGLAGVVLAHLSAESNRPTLALDVVGRILEDAGFGGYLEVASQDDPGDVLDVERLRHDRSPEQLTLL